MFPDGPGPLDFVDVEDGGERERRGHWLKRRTGWVGSRAEPVRPPTVGWCVMEGGHT